MTTGQPLALSEKCMVVCKLGPWADALGWLLLAGRGLAVGLAVFAGWECLLAGAGCWLAAAGWPAATLTCQSPLAIDYPTIKTKPASEYAAPADAEDRDRAEDDDRTVRRRGGTLSELKRLTVRQKPRIFRALFRQLNMAHSNVCEYPVCCRGGVANAQGSPSKFGGVERIRDGIEKRKGRRAGSVRGWARRWRRDGAARIEMGRRRRRKRRRRRRRALSKRCCRCCWTFDAALIRSSDYNRITPLRLDEHLPQRLRPLPLATSHLRLSPRRLRVAQRLRVRKWCRWAFLARFGRIAPCHPCTSTSTIPLDRTFSKQPN